MVKRIKTVKEWEDKGINWLDEIYETTDRFPDPNGTPTGSIPRQRSR